MRIIPVIDILNSEVVHGIAGQRHKYRPITSRLTASSQPLDIARAIRDTFDLAHLYVADLDGILNQQPNLEIYRSLVEDGFDLIVDAGVRNVSDAINVCDAGVKQLIVGLETCCTCNALVSISAAPIDVTFSLDLLNGKPQIHEVSSDWSNDPRELIQQAIRANVKSLLLLDLADVGMSTGGSTDSVCRFVRSTYPNVRLITGGGIREMDDVMRLESLGVDDVLVASALHDGRITRHDIRSLS